METSKSKNHPSYHYVGSRNILEAIDLNVGGQKITGVEDIKEWIQARSDEIVHGMIRATFVISEKEELTISGRHTEHVMCAKGQNVLSAGEIVFVLDGKEVYISEISNQSTGYCPRPSSWMVVETVLSKMGLDFPDYFTQAYEFRYCVKCGNTNLIKDDDFECLVCNAELDAEWNFDKKDRLS